MLLDTVREPFGFLALVVEEARLVAESDPGPEAIDSYQPLDEIEGSDFLDEVFGRLHKTGRSAKTVDEMESAVSRRMGCRTR